MCIHIYIYITSLYVCACMHIYIYIYIYVYTLSVSVRGAPNVMPVRVTMSAFVSCICHSDVYLCDVLCVYVSSLCYVH